MRAVVLKAFGGIENLEDREAPEPQAGQGQVKFRVRAISVNPTDYKARRGGNEGAVPMILGRDAAGEVVAVGDGVTEFAPGDEVMCYLPRFGDSGGEGYAEYVTVFQQFAVKKPAKLSFAEAAAIPLAALTAYEGAVMKARVGEGDSVFVAGGSGGVGTHAIQILRHLGARPILTTAGSDRSAAYLTENLGVPPEHILRYDGLSVEEMAERVVEMNGGRLPRATFDLVGRDMKRLCAKVVDFWGHFVSSAPEPGEPIPHFFATREGPMYSKSASFHSVFLRSPVRNGGPAYYGTFKKHLTVIRDWLKNGHISPPRITDLGPMTAESIGRAHLMLEKGHTQGKIVLSVP